MRSAFVPRSTIAMASPLPHGAAQPLLFGTSSAPLSPPDSASRRGRVSTTVAAWVRTRRATLAVLAGKGTGIVFPMRGRVLKRRPAPVGVSTHSQCVLFLGGAFRLVAWRAGHRCGRRLACSSGLPLRRLASSSLCC